jgi:cobalt-precorrin 5A hydrolase
MKIAAICINSQGEELYKLINKELKADLYKKQEGEVFKLKEVTEKLMESYEAIIFFSSTGIAVRAIAPFLKGKDKDPAVLVIDILGNYVISLLSGHLGGANALTLDIADIINSEPVITTATDNLGLCAPDIVAKDNGLIIEDLKKAKCIAASLVAGEKVFFVDEEDKLETPTGYVRRAFKEYYKDIRCDLPYAIDNSELDKKSSTNIYGSVSDNLLEDCKTKKANTVLVTNKSNFSKDDKTLYLIRKNLILGIGCRKSYSPDKMRDIVTKKLEELGYDKRAVKTVATVEIKKDEEAIRRLSQYLEAELKIATIEDIRKIQHRYKGSDFVEKTIGVRAVCEPSVELFGGTLLTEKLSIDGMTLCIGVEDI